jgi:hypothetical protein
MIGNRHHWHNNVSSLTGVVGAMYLDSEGKEIDSPDGEHGLYIKTRGEGGDTIPRVIQALVPSEYLCFQIGEAMQIHSGGALQATPHCIRAFKNGHVARVSYSLHIQPAPEEAVSVPLSLDPAKVIEGTHGKFLTQYQPSLEKRWKEAKDFHIFVDSTRRHYSTPPVSKLDQFEGLGTSGAMTTATAPSTSSSQVYPALSAGISTPSATPATTASTGPRKFAAPKSSAAPTTTAPGSTKFCSG